MADLLFLKRTDGQIIKYQGDDVIHDFVEIKRAGYDHIETVGDIYGRLSSIEHDFLVRDRIMARIFSFPISTRTFDWLKGISDEEFEKVIKEFKFSLSYSLFPVATEFDRKLDSRFGFGGALMRSLGHIPMETSTYFQRQWFMG
ncbi:hypothetical protein L1887_34020 [Cichorium endivia]|nr:hypothetical protein L1887_34020 [Cichorium endivia]